MSALTGECCRTGFPLLSKPASNAGVNYPKKDLVLAYYQVLLEGKGFCFNFDGEETLGGFFTTRWVKAVSLDDAENKAVELIKNDNSLNGVVVKSDESTPIIYLENIRSVSWLTYIWRKPGKGYSFYNEHDS
ncbi:hypothetical protein ISG33_11800 [Glaciecola sp. MH2013]|uniref:hypothetical protein n=1 Tax=Glaciecola sp. MH2013 TaxID=2785524 RepID=UPI00189D751A|nr:hypothetical protein [Glaciecola sp. MH2013]MBF7074083.1 hypothetical protein [Glaciecola sp. MH2013]